MNVDHPFHVDGEGRTARTDDADHVRDMVEQVLFTSPGERVMRPDFGTGLGRLVFEPNSTELASALQFTLQASLHTWLGDVVDVAAVEVASTESTLDISVSYTIRRTGEDRTETFAVEAG